MRACVSVETQAAGPGRGARERGGDVGHGRASDQIRQRAKRCSM